MSPLRTPLPIGPFQSLVTSTQHLGRFSILVTHVLQVCMIVRRAGVERLERPWLNKRSLETCPPELRQPLAYMLYLRSRWRPEGGAKLIVPAPWMEFLALGDGKCGTECTTGERRCPFCNVRFESEGATGLRLIVPDEELPQDIVSQLLTNFGASDGSPTTLVPRAFEGSHHASSRSDVSTTNSPQSSSGWLVDFAVVPGQDVSLESDPHCLLWGMKAPQIRRVPSRAASPDSRSGFLRPATIPEELIRHAKRHLPRLTSLVQGGTARTTIEPFPEWLILFSLIYDAHHVRIIAHLPRHRQPSPTPDAIDYSAHIVDELSLRPDSAANATASVPVSLCEQVVERLRLALALMTLRRHVLHLSKALFTPTGTRDAIGKTDGWTSLCTCDRHRSGGSDLDSESAKLCGSPASSLPCLSEYSTCPSSPHVREPNDVLIECGGEFSSSCRSCVSTCCSTCSSLLGSGNTSDTYSEDSDGQMEPPTLSLPQRSDEATHLNQLTETKRQEIVTWARDVIPTEHPVNDTYKMVIYQSYPKR